MKSYLYDYSLLLGLLILSSFPVLGQQLNFQEVSPYEEFRYHNMTVDQNDNFYIVSGDSTQVYTSTDASNWTEIPTNGIDKIKSIHFFNNGDILLCTSDQLYIQENNSWNLVFESLTPDIFQNCMVKDDVIYQTLNGDLSVSNNRGQSFTNLYSNPYSDFNDLDIRSSDNFIYLFNKYSFVTVDYNGQEQKKVDFRFRSGVIVNLEFFEVQPDDRILYGVYSSNQGADGYANGSVLYSANTSYIFDYIHDERCTRVYGGKIIGNNIIYNHGANEYDIFDLNTSSKQQKTTNLTGRFIINSNNLFIENNYAIAKVEDSNEGTATLLTSNVKFQFDDINRFEVSRDGTVYISNPYNLYNSEDGGNSWKQINLNSQQILDFDLTPGNILHAITKTELHITSDHGSNISTNNHNQYVRYSGQVQDIVTLHSVYAVNDTAAIFRSYRCGGGPTLGGISYTLDGGITIEDDFSSTVFPLEEYIELNNEIFGYSNETGFYSIHKVDPENLGAEIINASLPLYCLPIDESLIQFNEPSIATNSFISRDLGQTTEQLGVAPPGAIYKAKEREGTYVTNRYRVFLRKNLSESYESIDISSLGTWFRGFDSDFEGNIYIQSSTGIFTGNNTSKLYRVANEITHTQQIKGQLFFDENTNCAFDDSNNIDLNGWKVKLIGPNFELVDFADDGLFSFNVPLGEYELTAIAPANKWEFCEEKYEIVIDQNDEVVNLDIPLLTEEICSEYSININTPFLRKCNSNTISFDIKNTGTSTGENPEITITHDEYLEIESVSVSHTILSDTVFKVTLDNILVGETKKFSVTAKSSCDIELGHLHCMQAKIESSNTCQSTTTLEANLYQPNIGPFDPNDMRIFNQEGFEMLKYEKEEYQYYHVRFQNTGSDTAFNVSVLSVLDNKLDVSTIEVLGSSHDYKATLNDAQNLTMDFDNIMLPDSTTNLEASNGYFRFRIKPINTIQIGDELESYSDIFFDYNSPIRTNTALAIIGTPCDKPIYEYEKVSICAGESYLGFNRRGLYDKIVCGENACDTFKIIDLNINSTSRVLLDNYLCTGQIVDGVSSNSTIIDTTKSIFGCDSITTKRYFFYDIFDNTPTLENISICDGESYRNHTESGVYRDSIVVSTSCRIYETTLEVFDTYNDSLNVTICEGEEYLGITESGVYQDSLNTINGCDSIQTLILDVLPLSDSLCLGVSTLDIIDEKEIQIFPNPAQSYFNIKSNIEIIGVDILNTTLQKIYSQRINAVKDATINLETIIPGIYFVKVETIKGVIVKKIFIE